MSVKGGQCLSVLTHGFIKTTRKTPKRQLDLAKRRMKKILDERK
jgi:phage-related protein